MLQSTNFLFLDSKAQLLFITLKKSIKEKGEILK